MSGGINKEEYDTVEQLYVSGRPMRDIANLYGSSISAVHRILVAREVPRRKRGKPIDDGLVSRNEIILQLLKDGKSLSEVGRMMNLPRQRVHQIANPD